MPIKIATGAVPGYSKICIPDDLCKIIGLPKPRSGSVFIHFVLKILNRI
jgi:hypothetical protein